MGEFVNVFTVLSRCEVVRKSLLYGNFSLSPTVESRSYCKLASKVINSSTCTCMLEIKCSFLLLHVMFQESVGGLLDEGLDVFCEGR